MPLPISSNAQGVSVLIPAYNEEALLGGTIVSVRESFAALPDAPAYEVIVCDNNSTDRTAQVAAVHGVQVVFEPHNQIAKARNAAAARAQYPWLIFLDGDTLLNPELLRETLRALGSGEVCGGGTMIRFGEAEISRFGASLLRLWNWISASLQLAAGAYVFCLRAAWEDVGGFHEGVYASEELYFSRRVRRWGKSRGLRFQVLTGNPIVTSARKLEWHGQWALLGHVLRMAVPGALKRRDACSLWYSRPKN
jgi:glycosyltransferase involved in cell wall biosynthesis